MNQRKIVPGIIFIGIGILFLLRNLGYIHWITIGSLWRFWPLILVIIGINTIFRQYPVVPVITWAAFFAVLIGYALTAPQPLPWHQTSQTVVTESRSFIIEKEQETEEASLNLSVGAMRLTLEGTDDSLVTVEGFPESYRHQLSHSNQNRRAEVRISSNTETFFPGSRDTFHGNIALNREIPWDLDMNMGAVSGTLDFSDITFREFDLDVGAGDLTLILDEPLEDTRVQINAGASNIAIQLPENVSARITSGNVLSQTVMDDRYWNREGDTYFSVGYDPRQPTMNIDVKMGVGRMEVINR